jgi:hypothetical protein
MIWGSNGIQKPDKFVRFSNGFKDGDHSKTGQILSGFGLVLISLDRFIKNCHKKNIYYIKTVQTSI